MLPEAEAGKKKQRENKEKGKAREKEGREDNGFQYSLGFRNVVVAL